MSEYDTHCIVHGRSGVGPYPHPAECGLCALASVTVERDTAIKRAEEAEARLAVCEPDRVEKQEILRELVLLPIGAEHFDEIANRIREILDQRDTARREAEEARARVARQHDAVESVRAEMLGRIKAVEVQLAEERALRRKAVNSG